MKRFRSYFIRCILLCTSVFLITCHSEKRIRQDQTNLLIPLLFQEEKPKCPGLWALNFQTNLYRCVEAKKIADFSEVEIYMEKELLKKQEEGLYPSINYQQIGEAFQNKIKPQLETTFGVVSDVDRNNKITIFILNINPGGNLGSFIAGYVDPVNIIEDPGVGKDMRSNMQEIIYLDGVLLPQLREKTLQKGEADSILSVLAHEFQHLIRVQHQFGRNKLRAIIPLPRTEAEKTEFNRTVSFDDTWINEGMSELASDLAGYGPQVSRLHCFYGSSEGGCSNGFIGKSLFKWSSTILDYSFAYTFMKFLYENAGLTSEERNEFLKDSIEGRKYGFRGNTSEKFFELYKYTNRYNAQLLGDDSESIFRSLYATFLSHTFSFSHNSIMNYNDSGETSISNLLEKYNYPKELKDFAEKYSRLKPQEKSSFTLYASEVYRIKGTAKNSLSNSVIVQGESEFFVFNPSFQSENSFSEKVELKNLNETEPCAEKSIQENWIRYSLASQAYYYGFRKQMLSEL
ncbi:MAG: hypothetical protein H7A25_08755 [Leptospiraceae bacterium]|nr:hypothetical protein [Leptospiraceae bacterium]